MSASANCSCWRLPTEHGEILPLAYVCAHDEVRLALTDGRVVQGFSLGADWWSGPYGPEVWMEIERSGDESVIVAKTDITSATPVGGYTDRTEFFALVQGMIDGRVDREDPIRLIVDEHTTIEVTVEAHSLACAPPRHPRWQPSGSGVVARPGESSDHP